MQKTSPWLWTKLSIAALLLGVGAAAASDAPTFPAPAFNAAKAVKPKAPAHRADKPESLGEASIAQNMLFVSLNREASLSLYNSGGQLLFHLDAVRGNESIPLAGVNAGFLYVTLRAGSVEQTAKLVYSGK